VDPRVSALLGELEALAMPSDVLGATLAAAADELDRYDSARGTSKKVAPPGSPAPLHRVPAAERSGPER
jgi:hypothetical protein